MELRPKTSAESMPGKPEDSAEVDDSTTNSRKRKLTKMERYLQLKEERKEKRRAHKMRKRSRRDAAKAQGIAVASRAPQVRVKMADSSCRTRIVLDCAYDHMMSFKDVCKLAHQLSFCYSNNRCLKAPVQLYITGLGANHPSAGDTQKSAEEKKNTMARLRLSDVDRWDVHLKEEDYTELFPTDSIVYLCAESDYELPDRFEPELSSESSSAGPGFTSEDVYVIGGLVDHNHHQGFCYEQAISRGHRTARLPLDRAGIRLEGRRVLSLVHVFEALAAVVSGETTDWATALNVCLPQRKFPSNKETKEASPQFAGTDIKEIA